MGIESEQLVFDYLSRVGDLAHRTELTAAERARLVGELRARIDQMRAEAGGAQSQSAVRRILARIGEPEGVVAAAGGALPVPEPRTGEGNAAPSGGTQRTRLFKRPPARERPSVARPSAGASPPHLAGMDELGPEESNPDWWREAPDPHGDMSGPLATFRARPGGDLVPGFVGGIELPDVLRQPPEPDEKTAKDGAKDGAKGEGGGDGGDAAGAKGGAAPAGEKVAVEKAEDRAAATRAQVLKRLLPRRTKENPAGPAAGGLVELAAAALLVAGAVLGSLLPLAAGWLAAFWSPRLSRTEAKWAALGMPGLVAGAGAVWLWGRRDGRWGDRLPEGGEAMRQAMTDMWPVLLKVAAVAAALFLLWRARRRA